MVLKQGADRDMAVIKFENDVKMYGTQTFGMDNRTHEGFENDVKMYGTQTFPYGFDNKQGFENDVKMYGTQTKVVYIMA